MENRQQTPQVSEASAYDSNGQLLFWVSALVAGGSYFLLSVPVTATVVIFTIPYAGGKLLFRHFRRNPYHPDNFTSGQDRKRQNPRIEG